MSNNIAIKYNTDIDKIEAILEKLHEIGMDASEFKSSLLEITNEVDSKLAQLGKIGYNQKDSINNIYQYGIDKATKLLNALEQYNNYYQAINKCYYIEGAQNFMEIKDDELTVVVNDVINLLSIINEFDGVVDNSKEMLNRLYDFVYNLIKTEYSLKGSSKLLEYCNHDEISSYYINKYLLKEVQDIKESGQDTKEIDSILSRKNILGPIDLNINEELIQYVSIMKNREKYSIELADALSDLIKQLYVNESFLKELSKNKSSVINKKERAEEELKSSRSYNIKMLIRNVLPFVISLSSVLGLDFGIYKLVTGTEYKTEIQTYSSETGKTEVTEEYVGRINEINGKMVDSAVFMEIKSPWSKAGPDKNGDMYFERKTENYSIADVDYSDLEEYINIDINSIDGEYEYYEEVETKNVLTTSDSLTDTEIQVIKQNQDPNDSRHGDLGGFGGVVLFSFLMLMLDLFIMVGIEALFYETNTEGPIERLFELRRNIRALKWKEFNSSNWMTELNNIDEGLRKIVEENLEIKKLYLELIKNPKYKFLNDIYKAKKEQINSYLEKMDKDAVISLQLKSNKL